MDIASEASQCGAAAVFLSCRRPVHVVPRHIFGKPSDSMLPAWLGVTAPRRLLEIGVTCMIRLSRGSQASFKFPPPKFGLLRVRSLPHGMTQRFPPKMTRPEHTQGLWDP